MVLAVVILFCLLFPPVRNVLSQVALGIASPVWKISSPVFSTFSSLTAVFQEKNDLIAENQALREENARAQAMILDRNLLAEKVTKLEDALGRSNADNRVAADVLVGQGHAPYDTLIIDAGTENGIKVGDMVVYAGAGVIGEIAEAEVSTSKVKLFSSPGEKQFALIGQSHFPAEILGKGMGNFEAKVPQAGSVSIGDIIISAKGALVFGTVSAIEEKPAEPFKKILFRVPFNITEIQSVEVITSKR